MLLLVLRSWNAQHQANMKGERQIHVRELRLRIEIGAAGDYPPAILIGMDVPNIMVRIEDGFGINLLKEGYLEIGSLPLEVLADMLGFCLGRF